MPWRQWRIVHLAGAYFRSPFRHVSRLIEKRLSLRRTQPLFEFRSAQDRHFDNDGADLDAADDFEPPAIDAAARLPRDATISGCKFSENDRAVSERLTGSNRARTFSGSGPVLPYRERTGSGSGSGTTRNH